MNAGARKTSKLQAKVPTKAALSLEKPAAEKVFTPKYRPSSCSGDGWQLFCCESTLFLTRGKI